MKFSELANYLDRLEMTNSRLEMTKILAELFEKLDDGELKESVYLIQGMLGPKYNNPQFAMADKQVIKAIERLTEDDVNELFKKIGDLGKVIEIIKINTKKSDKNINQVFDDLIRIAKLSGTGSQEEKIEKLSELLIELDPKSAKYVIKIVLGKMRAGFSDMTVLDSLSWMVSGDKSLRADIEKIYNVKADLGEVAVKIKSNKLIIKNISSDPVIGIPILVARAERAKSVEEIWERNGVSAAEHKLDGLRIQAHVSKSQIKLFSRGLEDVTHMYPDVVEGLKKQIANDCILDGEMISVDSNNQYLAFKDTLQRKRKHDILEMMETVPLKYFVFDLLYADGESYLDKTNEERWNRLEKILNRKDDVVRLISRKIVKSAREIQDYFDEAIESGTEGIMVKKLDGKYKSGNRDFNWIKFKYELDTVDCVVMGYSVGEGKRVEFGIGEFLVGVYDHENDKYLTVAKIGSGAKDEEWVKIKRILDKLKVDKMPTRYVVDKIYNSDYWIKPEMVVEIRTNEISISPSHSSGYGLRFPRLVSIREKSSEDATSLEEIVRMYKLQKSDRKNG